MSQVSPQRRPTLTGWTTLPTAAALSALLACGGGSATSSDPTAGDLPEPDHVETPAEVVSDEPEHLPNFDELWDYSDPAATETAFREIYDGLGDGNEAYAQELLTQIARTYSLRSMFDQAHTTLDQVEPLLAADGIPRVRYHLERGRTYNSAGAKDTAYDHFLDAVELAESLHEAGNPRAERFYLDAMHMMGIAAEPDEAMEWNLRALALAEASDDDDVSSWQGPLLNNIGWSYFDRGDLDNALTYLERSLAYRQDKGVAGPIWIARYSVARVWREQGRVEDALEEQLTIMEEMDAAGEPRDPYVVEEIAWGLQATGRGDEAVPHFEFALEAFENDGWTPDNEPERIGRIRQALGL